jgi:hypothetical protein
MDISPCLDCKKRALGCHSKCTEYNEYKRRNDEYREKKQNFITEQKTILDYQMKELTKLKRRRCRKRRR